MNDGKGFLCTGFLCLVFCAGAIICQFYNNDGFIVHPSRVEGIAALIVNIIFFGFIELVLVCDWFVERRRGNVAELVAGAKAFLFVAVLPTLIAFIYTLYKVSAYIDRFLG